MSTGANVVGGKLDEADFYRRWWDDFGRDFPDRELGVATGSKYRAEDHEESN